VRVADTSSFYALPEGRLGIFVGGGASVRAGRVLGPDRMREMMLTGRRITADEGQRLGLSHELVESGAAEARARALAVQIAGNAPLTNQLILTALPRISDMSRNDGFWAEALTTAVSQSTADADEGLRSFLEKRPPVIATAGSGGRDLGQIVAADRSAYCIAANKYQLVRRIPRPWDLQFKTAWCANDPAWYPG
jgi:(methylthio)acryloyl-CoA hydratase